MRPWYAGNVVHTISTGNGNVIEALSWNPRHPVLAYNSTVGTERDGGVYCYVGIFAAPDKASSSRR